MELERRAGRPLGDRLVLRILRESEGGALSIGEDEMRDATASLSQASGIDAAPEGGCAFAVARALVRDGTIPPDADVVVYNTGSGASYRAPVA